MNDLTTRLIIALERISNLHKPCHIEGHYRTADVCSSELRAEWAVQGRHDERCTHRERHDPDESPCTWFTGHASSDPANCLGCGKPSPCPTLREVEAALR